VMIDSKPAHLVQTSDRGRLLVKPLTAKMLGSVGDVLNAHPRSRSKIHIIDSCLVTCIALLTAANALIAWIERALR
jgi:branched-subunit amino acid permease